MSSFQSASSYNKSPFDYTNDSSFEEDDDTGLPHHFEEPVSEEHATDDTNVEGEVAVDIIDSPYVSLTSPEWFSFKKLWLFTGPGLLMSIAYVDPGNLESDLQAGAYTNYSLLWVLFWSTALGLLLQILSLRLGVVTGKHLAQVCREHYPRPAYLALWLMTELAIIGSDIQEVLGSAIAFKLLFGLPLWAGCLITGFDTFTFLAIHFFGVRWLEAFFAFLISVMLVSFSINFVAGHPDAGLLFYGTAVPDMHDYAVMQAVGILGAVIMPHNLYLHSAMVQSRKINRKSVRAVKEANKYFSIESAIALFASFIINAAVLAVFAKGFFAEECAVMSPQKACLDFDANGNCQECKEIGLDSAGDALQGFLGKSATYVWAIGLLAAGQSSTMTGTYAGQFVMEGFLNLKVAPWIRTLFTRCFALGPAVAVALLAQKNQTAADNLDEWLNVLQSVQLPFAVLPLLKFTSSGIYMGKFKNHSYLSGFCWFIAFGLLAINVFLIQGTVSENLPPVWWVYLLIAILGIVYFAFVFYLIFEDTHGVWWPAWLRSASGSQEEKSRLLN